MALLDRFQVVLMPRHEVLATGLTLAEAVAYVGGYEEVNGEGQQQAVIALAQQPALAASGRHLRRNTAVHSQRPSAPLRSA
jgi:hypothetical protein